VSTRIEVRRHHYCTCNLCILIIIFEPFLRFTQMIYHWKDYKIPKLLCFRSFPKFCTFLKLIQKLIIRFSRLLVFSEIILSRFSYRSSEWCLWYTVGFVRKLRNLFILSIFRNSGWFKNNFKYGKKLFRRFSIFGHYFDWHFQTVYPIDANDMALESYGLGVTFSFWSFLRISYYLRAVLNIVDSDFWISRFCMNCFCNYF
jgi:hypothetical protein